MNREQQNERLERLLALDPAQVAVVLVDFQNDLCNPAVAAGEQAGAKRNAETAIRANDFAARAAAIGVRTIYSRQVLDLTQPKNADTSTSYRRISCQGSTVARTRPTAPCATTSGSRTVPPRATRNCWTAGSTDLDPFPGAEPTAAVAAPGLPQTRGRNSVGDQFGGASSKLSKVNGGATVQPTSV